MSRLNNELLSKSEMNFFYLMATRILFWLVMDGIPNLLEDTSKKTS